MSDANNTIQIRFGQFARRRCGLELVYSFTETLGTVPKLHYRLRLVVQEIEERTSPGDAVIARLGNELRETLRECRYGASLPAGGFADHAEVHVGSPRNHHMELQVRLIGSVSSEVRNAQ